MGKGPQSLTILVQKANLGAIFSVDALTSLFYLKVASMHGCVHQCRGRQTTWLCVVVVCQVYQ